MLSVNVARAADFEMRTNQHALLQPCFMHADLSRTRSLDCVDLFGFPLSTATNSALHVNTDQHIGFRIGLQLGGRDGLSGDE